MPLLTSITQTQWLTMSFGNFKSQVVETLLARVCSRSIAYLVNELTGQLVDSGELIQRLNPWVTVFCLIYQFFFGWLATVRWLLTDLVD